MVFAEALNVADSMMPNSGAIGITSVAALGTKI